MWVSFSRQEQKAAITAGQPAKGCEMIVWPPKKGPLRRAAQVREETPKVGGNTERDVRCCTAQFMLRCTIMLVRKWLRACMAGMQARSNPVPHLRVLMLRRGHHSFAL